MRVKRHKWGKLAKYRKELELGPMKGIQMSVIPAHELSPETAKYLAKLTGLYVAYIIPEDAYYYNWKPFGDNEQTRSL